jgi:hypothetical protein
MSRIPDCVGAWNEVNRIASFCAIDVVRYGVPSCWTLAAPHHLPDPALNAIDLVGRPSGGPVLRLQFTLAIITYRVCRSTKVAIWLLFEPSF